MPLCGISSDPRLQSTSQMGMISPLHPLHSHQLLYRDIYSLWNENIEVAEMLVKYNCISTQTTCVCVCACVRACEDANSKLVDVVTVADEDHVGSNLLQISKLRFGQKANLLFRL